MKVVRKRKQFNGFDWSFVFILLVLFTAIGCGGSGGGGGSDDPPDKTTGDNIVPIADAGPDLVVDEGDTVTLDGSGSEDDGIIETFEWTQSSGPEVAFTATDDPAIVTFIAPAVDQETIIEVTLTVTDDNGTVGEDTVTVVVRDTDGGGGKNQSPVAEAGDNQTVYEGATVTLDGSGSSDDGTITDFSWTWVSGPEVTLSATGNPAVATFIAPEVDQDTVIEIKLTVTDDKEATEEDTITVTVRDNKQPIADPGNNRTVNEGVEVTLDGGGSQGGDSNIDGWLWERVSGPEVDLGDNRQRTVTFTAPSVDKDEAIVLRLTITTADGDSDSAEATITVNNGPTASAGDDQTVNEGADVTLDGSASTDPAGNIQSWEWECVKTKELPNVCDDVVIVPDDKSPGKATFKAPAVVTDKEVAFDLTVTDDNGATAQDTVRITIKNTLSVDAGGDKTVNEGDTVHLTSTIDSTYRIKSKTWEKESGPDIKIISLPHPPYSTTFIAPEVDKNEDIVIRLTVVDEQGATETDTVTITVNNTPTANAVAVPQTVDENKSVVLDGSGSSDDVVSYVWSCLNVNNCVAIVPDPKDKSKAEFQAPEISKSEGTRKIAFKLTVTDAHNAEHSATITVTVRHVNKPPVAAITPNLSAIKVCPERTKTEWFSGSTSTDPDGDTIAFGWSQTSGPAVTLVSDPNDPSRVGVNVNFADHINQTVGIRLTVTDQSGASNSATRSINVVKDTDCPDIPHVALSQTALTEPPAIVDLKMEGESDWVLWSGGDTGESTLKSGAAGPDGPDQPVDPTASVRKSAELDLIGTYQMVDASAAGHVGPFPTDLPITPPDADLKRSGEPAVPQEDLLDSGIYFDYPESGEVHKGNGFSFEIDGDGGAQILTLYLGARQCTGKVEAVIVDAENQVVATDEVLIQTPDSGSYNLHAVQAVFIAPAETRLNLSFTLDDDQGSASRLALMAATLRPATVETPEIYPLGGAFAPGVVVTMESETPDAVIHYTVDGTEPTVDAARYMGPFSIDTEGIFNIKSKGFCPGYRESDTAAARFEIQAETSSE